MERFERTRIPLRVGFPARQRLVAWGVLIWSLWIAGGCRTVADYTAADLPLELRASRNQSRASVDLSSIARQSINEDIIYPGDVLKVTVATGVESTEPKSWPLRVTNAGQIDVPLVGAVKLAGLTLVEAEHEIRRAGIERDVYRQPHVSVLMQQRRMIRVRVVGAVETPGVYELPAAGSDLLAAIVAAGGLSEKAGTRVEVRHPNGTLVSDSPAYQGVRLASFVQSPEAPNRTVEIDLAADPSALASADLHVEDGTVVMVGEKTNHSVSVIGLVRRPDNYDLPMDESLRILDALALAGGRRVSVADNVRVIRQVTGRDEPVVIAVSVKSAKRRGNENLVLAPGDVVTVEETPVTFFVETIQNFIRFGFTSAIPGI